MKKLGIIIDSSAGINKKEAEKLGYYFLPILIDIDGKEYKSGEDLTYEDLIKKFKEEKDIEIKTAAISIGLMEETFKKASGENEKVIYIPISQKLSSVYSTAKRLSENFSNIHVYESNFISPWFYILFKEINNEWGFDETIKKLDYLNNNQKAYIIPKTLDKLYKGGRLKKTQYLTGNLLKISPIIKWNNGKLDENEILKTRNIKKGIKIGIENLINEQKDLKNKKYGFFIIDISSEKEYIIRILNDKGINKNQIEIVKIGSEVLSHLGPDFASFGIYNK